MTETIILRAVTLTHVRYRKGDDLGHALAWASLLPVFIGLGGFVTHFIFRRELQAFCFGLGLIVSEVINQVIKELVQEVRPATCEALEMCDSHGWPSSHSQYMCFFAVYATLLSGSFSDLCGISSSTSSLHLGFQPWKTLSSVATCGSKIAPIFLMLLDLSTRIPEPLEQTWILKMKAKSPRTD
ncbi:hypothetical protein CY35_14G081600 [Sphagnum magellanicum]|nr:hypothetical protein CY35_14G081600 [Sphagnum magellanicum]